MPNREILLKKLKLENGATDNEIKIAYEKLRHTYELVAISSTDNDVKQIAEKKLSELKALSDSVIGDINLEIVHDDEYGEIVKATYKLLENSHSNEKDISAMIDKLKNTTMTSENYYLQTLLYLEINNGFPGCENAKKTIENALVIEPNNEAYLALKKGIDSVIQAKIEYDEEQLRIQEEQLREQQERQKQLEAEAQAQKRRAICGGIFECICGCIGGFFQCVCSCCSCCDDCC